MSDDRVVLYLSPLPPPAGGIGTWTRTLVLRGLPDGLRPVVVDNQHLPDREVFRHLLVLVRPDQHVAWRGNLLPQDVAGLVRQIRGADLPG